MPIGTLFGPCLVAALSSLASLLAPVSSAAAQKPDTATMVRTRIRVLGVFDRQSGEPIEGVEVRDFNTGFSALTTRTGTVGLLLTDTLGTLVNIKKIGYAPQTIMISTAIKDTVPLTIDLVRAGQLLETVMVTAEGRTYKLGAADTVKALLDNGFYERRATSVAPANAFITGEKLKATMLLSDARFFGRGICEENVFVDGVRMTVDARKNQFQKEGIDQYLDPSQVAGIETYQFGDLPSSSTNTFSGPAALSGVTSVSAIVNGLNSMTVTGCVTMIWLKR